jgi:hypothetical protein
MSHREQTIERMKNHGTILAIQDTSHQKKKVENG